MHTLTNCQAAAGGRTQCFTLCAAFFTKFHFAHTFFCFFVSHHFSHLNPSASPYDTETFTKISFLDIVSFTREMFQRTVPRWISKSVGVAKTVGQVSTDGMQRRGGGGGSDRRPKEKEPLKRAIILSQAHTYIIYSLRPQLLFFCCLGFKMTTTKWH